MTDTSTGLSSTYGDAVSPTEPAIIDVAATIPANATVIYFKAPGFPEKTARECINGSYFKYTHDIVDEPGALKEFMSANPGAVQKFGPVKKFNVHTFRPETLDLDRDS